MTGTRGEIEAATKRLRDEYGSLFEDVAAVLFKHDPVGINFEDNRDEYYPEVRTILPRLRSCHSVEDVMTVVHEEFQRWFDAETAGSRGNYRRVAAEIWSLWENRKGCSGENMPIKEYVHAGGSKTVDTYSENGLLVQRDDLEQSGTLSTRAFYRYDASDNNIEILITDGEGKQRWRLVFNYDEDNRRIEQEEYDANNVLIYRHQYSYTEPNDKIRAKVFDKTGKLLEESVEDVV